MAIRAYLYVTATYFAPKSWNQVSKTDESCHNSGKEKQQRVLCWERSVELWKSDGGKLLWQRCCKEEMQAVRWLTQQLLSSCGLVSAREYPAIILLSYHGQNIFFVGVTNVEYQDDPALLGLPMQQFNPKISTTNFSTQVFFALVAFYPKSAQTVHPTQFV